MVGRMFPMDPEGASCHLCPQILLPICTTATLHILMFSVYFLVGILGLLSPVSLLYFILWVYLLHFVLISTFWLTATLCLSCNVSHDPPLWLLIIQLNCLTPCIVPFPVTLVPLPFICVSCIWIDYLYRYHIVLLPRRIKPLDSIRMYPWIFPISESFDGCVNW